MCLLTNLHRKINVIFMHVKFNQSFLQVPSIVIHLCSSTVEKAPHSGWIMQSGTSFDPSNFALCAVLTTRSSGAECHILHLEPKTNVVKGKLEPMSLSYKLDAISGWTSVYMKTVIRRFQSGHNSQCQYLCFLAKQSRKWLMKVTIGQNALLFCWKVAIQGGIIRQEILFYKPQLL